MIPIRASLLFAVLLPAALQAQEPRPMNRDGTLVEQTACPPYPRTYERWLRGNERGYDAEVEEAKKLGVTMQPFAALAPHLLTREEFERRKAYEGFECLHIIYFSDGLRVTGYLWKPKDTAGKKLPLILYNRGGNREFGRLSPWEEEGFYSYVSKGFVVIASQYRGVEGGEGKEEFGGAEIHDVLNLIPLARSLGYVDMDKTFLLGVSRGGMETYLALKNGIAVKAAAVVSGEADLTASSKDRPEMMGVYRELIPGYAQRGPELLRARSVIDWPEKINVPILILHGTADWRTSPKDQALALAEKLQTLGKTYELVMYAQDSHGLPFNWRDRDQRIVEWFMRYMK
ncbi:MAG TPA: prolyl oligopeptidase family serine peptidase [Thermoanaerobaculia bacterium]|nr:prolyl oligopeptidase family serine peptidase [Thermoanaerobaculia bacterium]